MSYELANEKWLDGKKRGLLGQFASGQGYADLVAAATEADYPTLHEFFRLGYTLRVKTARTELAALADASKKDVASTALALADLMDGEKFSMIASGAS